MGEIKDKRNNWTHICIYILLFIGNTKFSSNGNNFQANIYRFYVKLRSQKNTL